MAIKTCELSIPKKKILGMWDFSTVVVCGEPAVGLVEGFHACAKHLHMTEAEYYRCYPDGLDDERQQKDE